MRRMTVFVNLNQAVRFGPDRALNQLITDSDDARVVLFGLEPGQSIPAHSSSSTVLMQVVDGKGRFLVGEEERSVGPGDLAICPPNCLHAMFAGREGRMVVVAVMAPRP